MNRGFQTPAGLTRPDADTGPFCYGHYTCLEITTGHDNLFIGPNTRGIFWQQQASKTWRVIIVRVGEHP